MYRQPIINTCHGSRIRTCLAIPARSLSRWLFLWTPIMPTCSLNYQLPLIYLLSVFSFLHTVSSFRGKNVSSGRSVSKWREREMRKEKRCLVWIIDASLSFRSLCMCSWKCTLFLLIPFFPPSTPYYDTPETHLPLVIIFMENSMSVLSPAFTARLINCHDYRVFPADIDEAGTKIS